MESLQKGEQVHSLALVPQQPRSPGDESSGEECRTPTLNTICQLNNNLKTTTMKRRSRTPLYQCQKEMPSAEAVISRRFNLNTSLTEYLVKWRGLSEEENTWLPETIFTPTPKMIHDYEQIIIKSNNICRNKKRKSQRIHSRVSGIETDETEVSDEIVRKGVQNLVFLMEEEIKKRSPEIYHRVVVLAKEASKKVIDSDNSDSTIQPISEIPLPSLDAQPAEEVSAEPKSVLAKTLPCEETSVVLRLEESFKQMKLRVMSECGFDEEYSLADVAKVKKDVRSRKAEVVDVVKTESGVYYFVQGSDKSKPPLLLAKSEVTSLDCEMVLRYYEEQLG